MKTAVIYHSQTGFTRKYAEWLSEAAGADCFDLAAAKKRSFDGYQAIVFGSWACAGRISKISWFKERAASWPEKTLIVFSTGGSPAESPEIAAFLRNQFSEEERGRIHAFYCPGGFCYEKMSAGSKLMMKMFRKMIGAKKEKTREEEEMLKMISHSYDLTDKKYLEPILALLKEQSAQAQ